MKKLILSFVAVFFLSFASMAQTTKVDLEKMFGPLVNQPVPAEVKGASVGAARDRVLLHYVESQKGWVVIVGNNNGIVNFYTTSNLSIKGDLAVALKKKTPRSLEECEDKPSDFGVVLCVGGVIASTLESLFSW